MDRVYQSNAVETPPEPVASSGSYPTAGSKVTGQVATVPGPYWFYSVTEELRNALIAVGITPDPAKVNQLGEAFGKFLPLTGGTLTGPLVLRSGYPVIRNASANVRLILLGGTAYEDGASLYLWGADNESQPGEFVLYAKSAQGTAQLKGKPTGELLWVDKQVVCVDSWRSGSNWYRKYSDGFIEQGGTMKAESGVGWKTLNFNVAFSDTNYFVTPTKLNVYDSATNSSHEFVMARAGGHIHETDLSTTYCRVFAYGGDSVKWYACGY